MPHSGSYAHESFSIRALEGHQLMRNQRFPSLLGREPVVNHVHIIALARIGRAC